MEMEDEGITEEIEAATSGQVVETGTDPEPASDATAQSESAPRGWQDGDNFRSGESIDAAFEIQANHTKFNAANTQRAQKHAEDVATHNSEHQQRMSELDRRIAQLGQQQLTQEPKQDLGFDLQDLDPGQRHLLDQIKQMQDSHSKQFAELRQGFGPMNEQIQAFEIEKAEAARDAGFKAEDDEIEMTAKQYGVDTRYLVAAWHTDRKNQTLEQLAQTLVNEVSDAKLPTGEQLAIPGRPAQVGSGGRSGASIAAPDNILPIGAGSQAKITQVMKELDAMETAQSG